MVKQHIFQDGLLGFYLVEIYESGRVVLKIKENGWSDIWSLPVDEVTKEYL